MHEFPSDSVEVKSLVNNKNSFLQCNPTPGGGNQGNRQRVPSIFLDHLHHTQVRRARYKEYSQNHFLPTQNTDSLENGTVDNVSGNPESYRHLRTPQPHSFGRGFHYKFIVKIF